MPFSYRKYIYFSANLHRIAEIRGTKAKRFWFFLASIEMKMVITMCHNLNMSRQFVLHQMLFIEGICTEIAFVCITHTHIGATPKWIPSIASVCCVCFLQYRTAIIRVWHCSLLSMGLVWCCVSNQRNRLDIKFYCGVKHKEICICNGAFHSAHSTVIKLHLHTSLQSQYIEIECDGLYSVEMVVFMAIAFIYILIIWFLCSLTKNARRPSQYAAQLNEYSEQML